jgi:adenylate cyclase
VGVEIEHKYLVIQELWVKENPHHSIEIKQAYIFSDPTKTIRVRTHDEKGYITIKGKSTGASRPEFEYEIPFSEAEELIKNFCSDVIEKTRHYITFANNLWEVDEFHGKNKGLIIAEIELKNETEPYSKPVWIGKDVTLDSRYFNSNLCRYPFSGW